MAAPASAKYNGLTRSPFGEKRRVAVRTEEGYYPAWERLLQLHKLDFWHNTISMRSEAGWPDYTVFGLGWHAWVELKAVRVSGRIGKLSVAQQRYKATIELAGGEYRVFTLPTDWPAVDDWLCGHTGLEIRGFEARL